MDKNIPEIRFDGFDSEWEQRKLGGEAIEILAGGDIDKEKAVEDGIYPIYANALTNDGIVGYYNDYYRVKAPAVTVTGRGEVGHAQARMTDFTPVVRLLAIRSNHDCYFLENAINNHEVIVESTGVPQLTVPQLSSYNISFPQNIEEEKKIGEYFASLDHLITLYQKKYDKLIATKKSMLDKMFPKKDSNVPEIRFAGFNESWKKYRLSDFGKATGGTSIESEFSEDGIYKVISIGSYSENSTYRDQGIRAIKSEKTFNRLLNKGDITMILNDKTASGNIIGRVLLIEESGIYVYNQRTERVEVDQVKYDSQFVYTMLNAPEIRDRIIKQSQGNTQIYVNWTTISQTEYLVPQIDEQRKIGEYFRNLDNLINLQQQELEKLKNIKKSLLDKMFV